MVANSVLLESALFSYDTFFSSADYAGTAALPKLSSGSAVDRGWQPLSSAAAPGGVQTVDLSGFTKGTPLEGATITSAAHFYTGELEGKQTLVIAFRSTDEGAAEFAFQGAQLPENPAGAKYGWDLYYGAHAPAVAQALALAANPQSGIEQVLITGHSLGAVVAELVVARLIQDPASPLGAAAALLAEKTITVTFGSPGSTADASDLDVFNLFHSDDLVARLSDLSPVFEQGGVAREGVELAVSRPEGTLPAFAPADLDTLEEVFAASQNPLYKIEHASQLYIDTAQVLTANEHLVPGIADAQTDAFRWLSSNLENTRLGSNEGEMMKGAQSEDLLLGRGGADVLCGRGGDDGLGGGDGNDLLAAGDGDDRMDGGAGDDRIFAGTGDDVVFVSAGRDLICGGKGDDLAIFNGAFADFDLTVWRKGVQAERASDEPEIATLRGIELLQFDDATYRLEGGELVLQGAGEADLFA
jgi:hypothetical protein